MDRNQRRILRLRSHVINGQYNGFVKCVKEAHDLAIEEDSKDILGKGLGDLTVPALKEKAKKKGIEGYSNMKKKELIEELEGD